MGTLVSKHPTELRETKINVYKEGSMNISVNTPQTGVWAQKKMFPDQRTMNAATPTIYQNDRGNAIAKNKTKMKYTVCFTQ
jgi:hypothetical protein